jgi:hypothetical protein
VRGRVSAENKSLYPQPAPPRTGWTKSYPNQLKTLLNPRGSVRIEAVRGGFAGWADFYPALPGLYVSEYGPLDGF